VTNCPNCGAPIDLTAMQCAYCGTPYLARKRGTTVAVPEITIDPRQLAPLIQQLDLGLITPNEVRRRIGLSEI